MVRSASPSCPHSLLATLLHYLELSTQTGMGMVAPCLDPFLAACKQVQKVLPLGPPFIQCHVPDSGWALCTGAQGRTFRGCRRVVRGAPVPRSMSPSPSASLLGATWGSPHWQWALCARAPLCVGTAPPCWATGQLALWPHLWGPFLFFWPQLMSPPHASPRSPRAVPVICPLELLLSTSLSSPTPHFLAVARP